MRMMRMLRWAGVAAGAYYVYQNYIKPERREVETVEERRVPTM